MRSFDVSKAANRCGQIRLAESLLNQASMLCPMEARPYVWLSATMEDPEQQRAYLVQAVARAEQCRRPSRIGAAVRQDRSPAPNA